MILRFAPSRFLALFALLVSGLIFAPFASLHGQTTKDAQDQSGQTPYPGTPVEEIVARVNDQVISTSDYDKSVQDLEQQAQQHQWTQQQLFEQKQNLLRDLIDQQLLLSRGKQLDITGETELVKQLDDMRKQYHLDTLDDLQKAAEAQGVTWEDFKASMRNRIIAQQVIRDEVGAHINISPSEIQAYYNAHKQEFDEPEQVRLSEILIPTANPDDAAQVATAKAKADDTETKLKGGADFAELAKTESTGVTASNGGDLGDFKRGQLDKVFEDQTFDLKPGQYTEPIRTKQGYVIMKVTEHTPGGIAPMKDVEVQIEDQIGMSKMNPALRTYLTKLREDAYIDIAHGYEDSAASPNEMKPVYSAYTPPAPKKKQHVTRARFNTGRGRKAGAQAQTAADTTTTPTATSAATTSAAANSNQPQTSTKQEASAKQAPMKPGKKEKIRYGQAPRETLSAAVPATTEDAGANKGETEVASNNTAANVIPTPNDQPEAKKEKTRFSARPKDKKKGPKVDPFAPPPPTSDELATQKQQAKPLGLNGDTSKKKKSPSQEGPKRRMSDQNKQTQPTTTQPSTPATPAPTTPPPSGNPGQ
jgi:peptidyl-prolyl cis-trans isomerase SurA